MLLVVLCEHLVSGLVVALHSPAPALHVRLKILNLGRPPLVVQTFNSTKKVVDLGVVDVPFIAKVGPGHVAFVAVGIVRPSNFSSDI
jgi:hypothetical protein